MWLKRERIRDASVDMFDTGQGTQRIVGGDDEIFALVICMLQLVSSMDLLGGRYRVDRHTR